MLDDHTSVESRTEIISIRPDASLAELCALLIDCEKAQRRYQWTSGLILMQLIKAPESPKKPAEFVEWLTEQTNMVLSQSEVERRLAVYRFYSRFPSDAGIIDLIERGGVQMAYRASKLIDQSQPDQARAVLTACVEQPNAVNETLRRFGETKRRLNRVTLNRRNFAAARASLEAAKQRFRNEEWVPLDIVLVMLDKLEKNR